eukprot:15457981-Alexandrium_andersonii.AAC.1
MEQALARSGHRLRRHKCKFRAPAEERPTDGGACLEEFRGLIPQVVGGLPALGAAMQCQCE